MRKAKNANMKDEADKAWNDIAKRGATYGIRKGVDAELMKKWLLDPSRNTTSINPIKKTYSCIKNQAHPKAI